MMIMMIMIMIMITTIMRSSAQLACVKMEKSDSVRWIGGVKS